MAQFKTVARASEIAPGTMTLIDVDGEEVVIANSEGKFFAFSNACTHVGGPLVEGELEGDTVTCPWHGTVFNLASGAALQGPGQDPVPTYQLRVEGDDIQIAIP